MRTAALRLATAFAVLVVALPLAGVFPTVSSQAQAPPVWWGSIDSKEGYHMRVPVTVVNPHPVTLHDPVVQADLDIAALLRAAGWPTTAAGAPKGFTLALDSVRVVAMTNLKPPTMPGDGRPAVYDATASGDNRFVAPSTVYPGLITHTGAQPYNAESNPAITVFWRVQGALEPARAGSTEGQRWFYVYFDSTRNPGHDTPPPSGPEAGALAALHWGGAGGLAYGYLPEVGDGELGSVTLLGLHPGTLYTIEVDSGGFAVSPGLANRALGQDQVQSHILRSLEGGTAFRVRSNYPLLAFVDPKGFVPALDGGFAGRQFVFQAGDRSAYFTDGGTRAGSTIQVQRLPDGPVETLHIADAQNPLPYTLGAWVSERASSSCQPATKPPNSLQLTPGQLYRATVTGGPVLLQHGTPAPLMQVPAADGGPTGDSFASVLHETPFVAGAVCASDPRNRDWMMAGELPGAVTLVSAGGERTLPASPDRVGPLSDGRATKNRPLQWSSTVPAWLFTGDAGAGSIPDVAGAFGGRDALEFTGFGEAVVFAMYPETTVTAQVVRTGGTESRHETLGEGESFRLADDEADRVIAYRLTSDRPLAVYGADHRPGALASRPLAVDGQIGKLDFRGFALGLRVNPSERSVLPGVPTQFTVVVTNLARSATGVGQEDVVDLSVTDPGGGWTAEIDKQFVGVAANGVQTALLTIVPPSTAGAGEQAVVTVTATSRGNPATQITERATAYLKSSHGVGLWFDVAGGVKSQVRTIQPAGDGPSVATYDLVVRNEGTVDDRIAVVPGDDRDGWKALLLFEGKEVDAFNLAPGTSAEFNLQVTAPDVVAGTFTTTVTATSVSEPARFDRVTAITKLSAPSDVNASVHPMTALVKPGDEGVFQMTLHNVGKGPAELRFENQTSAPAEWPAVKTFFLEPSGVKAPIDLLSLDPGETAVVHASLRVPDGAAAGETALLRLAARANATTLAFEVFPAVVTMAVHDLRLDRSASFTTGPASTLAEILRVSNHGNTDEALRLQQGITPAGWSVGLPGNVSVAVGAVADIPFELKVPATAAPGRYNVSFVGAAKDGTFHEFNLTVDVRLEGAASAARLGDTEAQPGRPVTVFLPVNNTANSPLAVRVTSGAGEAWPLVDPVGILLEPGASSIVPVTLMVPASAQDGLSRQVVVLSFEPTLPGVAAFQRQVDLAIEVGRPTLRLLGHTEALTPGGRLVTLTVANEGTRTAHDVVFDLEADGQRRDRQRIDSLAPNATALVTLLDSNGAGDLLVLVDPEGSTAASPLQPLLIEASGKDAPFPGASASALLLLVAWTLRRRAGWLQAGNIPARQVK